VVNYIFPSYPRRRRRRMPPPFVPRHGKHMPTNHLSHVLFIHKSNLQFTAAVCYMADVPRLSVMSYRALSTSLFPCLARWQPSKPAIAVSLSLDACWCFNTAIKLASRSVHVHVWCTHKKARSHLSAVLILQIFCCPEPVHQRLH